MSVRDAWERYRANLAIHFNMSTNEVDALIRRNDPETIFCAGYASRDKEVRDFALGDDTNKWIMTPKVTATGPTHSKEVCQVCKGMKDVE